MLFGCKKIGWDYVNLPHKKHKLRNIILYNIIFNISNLITLFNKAKKIKIKIKDAFPLTLALIHFQFRQFADLLTKSDIK